LFVAYEVSGYPTFKYFKYFDKERKPYDGGRTKADFIQFMKDPVPILFVSISAEKLSDKFLP
jgi:hypothetical protein